MSADVLDLPITSSATEAENSLRDELPSVGPVICYGNTIQAVTGTYARSTPEALEDAVNRFAKPRGNVFKFKRKAN